MNKVKPTICVIIVTYNRKELLINLLEKLEQQTYSVNCVLIVDNNSSDGTDKLLLEHNYIERITQGELVFKNIGNWNFAYYKNNINVGGAGGFAKAFELVKTLPYDYIWAMDDDVSPEKDCLEIMLNFIDKDSQMVIPCRGDEKFKDYAIRHYNLTNPMYFHINQRKRDCILFSNITEPYVVVEDMAFEGPLMTKDLIEKIGIPNKDYFILFDDTDFAHRASKVTQIRYIKNAKLRKMIVPKHTVKWSWKSYYNFRNSVYFERLYGQNWMVKTISPLLRLLDLTIKATVKGNFYRIKWLYRGYMDAIHNKMGKTYDPSDIPSL